MGSDVMGISSLVRRAAQSLQMQPDELPLASHGVAKTATFGPCRWYAPSTSFRFFSPRTSSCPSTIASAWREGGKAAQRRSKGRVMNHPEGHNKQGG